MNHLLLSWRLGVNQLNSDFVQLEDEIPVLSSMQDNRSPCELFVFSVFGFEEVRKKKKEEKGVKPSFPALPVRPLR